jgi:hypothetical protein
MNVLVIILILLKNEIAPSFERAIAQGARLPSHLPDSDKPTRLSLPDLAPSASAVVVEVSQGRSLHLSG